MTEALHDEIYIGAYRLRVGTPEGARVSGVPPEMRPRAASRRTVRILPPDLSTFVGRIPATESAASALESGLPAEIFGGEGAGKTAFLIHLAHHVSASHPGRVGVVSARDLPLEDVVQQLFEILFQSPHRMKVSAPALRALEAERAWLFLDDLELEPDGVQAVLAAVPACAVAIVSPERRLWGEGRSEPLEGLDPHTAATLYERRLGRPLHDAERDAVHALVATTAGSPLAIVLAAGLARESRLAPGEIERLAAAEGSMEGAAVASLETDERRVAAALAALGGWDVSADDVAAISATEQARSALEALVRRGIAHMAEGRFGMAGTVAVETARRTDLGEWERRAAARYRAEATRRVGDTAWALSERGPLLEVLERAAAARHWQDVLALARAVDGAYALSGRWGTWERVIELALQAARHIPDDAGEAWALHQRGTRALCLGAADAARDDLTSAAAIREAIGDAAGAAATRANLEHVPGAPAVVIAPPPSPPAAAAVRSAPSPFFFLALALATIAILTIVILAVRGQRTDGEGTLFVLGSEEMEYGSMPVGVAADPRVLVIENRGDDPVRVRSVRIEGEAAGDYVVLRDDCTGRTVPPTQGCALVTAFVPSAVGPRLARLVFAGQDGGRMVVLRGAGGAAGEEAADTTSGPALEVSPVRVAFGEQEIGTTGGPSPVLFVNRSGEPSRPVLRIDAGPSREFAIQEDRCTNAVVPGGGTCDVQILFRPVGEGLRGAVLFVRDAVTNRTWTVALTGVGTADAEPGEDTTGDVVPDADVTEEGGLAGPERISFGVQERRTRSAVQSVVVENRLGRDIRIATVRLSGIDAGSYGLGNDGCSGALLTAGGRCGVDVWFEPSQPGERRAALVVRDGTGTVTREIPLTGTGG